MAEQGPLTDDLRAMVQRLKALAEGGDAPVRGTSGSKLARGFAKAAKQTAPAGAASGPQRAVTGMGTSGPARLTYDNGDTYEGDAIGGSIRHGHGTHTCSNGDVYVGQWRRDVRHGKGRLATRAGFEYEGGWKENHADGHGAARYPDGHSYEGEWALDARCGFGTLHHANGDVYVGQWQADVIHGQGQWRYHDGSTLEGEFVHGQCVSGTARGPKDEWSYTGQLKGGQYHGEGVYVDGGSYRYRGQWRDGLRHGQGECEYADGSKYVGAWEGGRRSGAGRHSTRDGSSYVGGWEDDAMHGKGRLVQADGSVYDGALRGGVRHGWGAEVTSTGDKYRGGWKDGRRHGEGICLYANGDCYKGEWVEGQRHGYGAMRFSDGVVFRGLWHHDQWVQSPACPHLTVVSGRGMAAAVAGDATSFVIEARDDNNNRRLSGGDLFLAYLVPRRHLDLGTLPAPGPAAASSHATATAVHRPSMRSMLAAELGHGSGPGDGGGGAGPAMVASMHDNDDGTYTVTYVATESGLYDLHVLAAGWGLPPRHGDDDYDGGGRAAAGQATEEAPGGGHTGGDAGCAPSMPCPVDTTAHGVTLPQGWEAAWAVGVSPYLLQVAPGPPDSRRSTVEGLGRSRAQQGVPAHFVVQPRDRFGNASWELSPAGPAGGGYQVTISDAAGCIPVTTEPFACSWSGPDAAPATPADTSTSAAAAPGPGPADDGLASTQVSTEPCSATALAAAHVLVRYTAPRPGFFVVSVVGPDGRHLAHSPYSLQVAPSAATSGAAGTALAIMAPEPAGGANGARTDGAKPSQARHPVAAALGSDDGDDSDDNDGVCQLEQRAGVEPERAFVKANPSVPVIENLEDLWKVDVLQKARARRAAAAAVAAAAAAAAGTAAAKAATAAAAAAPDGSLSVGPAGPV